MGELTKSGDAIEGDAISGHSRDPLIPRGVVKQNGLRCYRFSASFNIKAHITASLSVTEDERKLEPTASSSMDDRIICERAVLHSLKNRYGSSVEKGSATHKANHWKFPQQTSVKIEIPHQEIQNARDRRAAQLSSADVKTTAPASETKKLPKRL